MVPFEITHFSKELTWLETVAKHAKVSTRTEFTVEKAFKVGLSRWRSRIFYPRTLSPGAGEDKG